MGPGHYSMGFGMGWIGMWLYPVLMIGIVFLVIYLIFGRKTDKVTRNGLDHFPGTSTHSETALDLLKKRYAKGEITEEEFELVKKGLQS